MARPFKIGHKKMGGRKKGSLNIVGTDLKQLLNRMYPEDVLERMWRAKMRSKDPHLAFKAFELMLHYRFGKPIQPIVGEENAPPIKIDISAIPSYRVKA